MDLKTTTYTALVDSVDYLGYTPQDDFAVMCVRIREPRGTASVHWAVTPSFLVSPQAIEALRRALSEYDNRTKFAKPAPL